MSELQGNNIVSAKLIWGEEAEIISEVMMDKVPGLVVEDNESYLSLTVDGKDLEFDMNEIAEEMGHAYSVGKFLAVLTTYKGDIDVGDDSVSIRVFNPEKETV
ncbi:hypothetical protein G8770_04235 [Aestuariicella hydrocarbonica]|uniref:Monooxygenase n=1 Tax=Pseudomaricurvus hydrocarbonicus TaxID=1470433 RepID=A0A9E5JSI4_9GAMM|nr:MmoB/DmpM family protein [Aestuariicella hydrocarbonica]NHO64753.1 hypothetical protein [Aestuariicella hydrocarbonica]